MFVFLMFREKLAKLYSKNNQILTFNHQRISIDDFSKILAQYALLTKMPKDTLVIIMNH